MNGMIISFNFGVVNLCNGILFKRESTYLEKKQTPNQYQLQ